MSRHGHTHAAARGRRDCARDLPRPCQVDEGGGRAGDGGAGMDLDSARGQHLPSRKVPRDEENHIFLMKRETAMRIYAASAARSPADRLSFNRKIGGITLDSYTVWGREFVRKENC